MTKYQDKVKCHVDYNDLHISALSLSFISVRQDGLVTQFI